MSVATLLEYQNDSITAISGSIANRWSAIEGIKYWPAPYLLTRHVHHGQCDLAVMR